MWSLVWMQLTKAAVETAILLFGSSWRPRFRFSYVRIRELFGFAGPLVLQTLWNFANDELPKIVLGRVPRPSCRRHICAGASTSRSAGGIVALAAHGHHLANRVPHPGSAGKINNFFNATVRVAGIIGFPAFFGFAAVAPIAVPFIFGQQ